MLTLEINGQKHKCPACWEELTTDTYQRIIREWEPDEPDLSKRNYFHLFAILTGTSFKEFKGTSESELTIWRAIRWFFEQDIKLFHEELPAALEIAGKRIAIPRKLGHMSIGQMIHIRQTISTAKVEAVLSRVTAAVLQPMIDNGPFDADRVEEVEKEVLNMPITLIAPIGFFSVRRALEYGRKQLTVLRLIRNNLGQMFEGMSRKWRRSGGFVRMTTSP